MGRTQSTQDAGLADLEALITAPTQNSARMGRKAGGMERVLHVVCLALVGLLAGACGGADSVSGDEHDGAGGCSLSSDCPSGVCTGEVCAAAACDDGSKNGAETDVDCGGGACLTCADGKACASDVDCNSAVCAGGVCVPAACTDGAQNGVETDVDCGGTGCPKCADGKTCEAVGDCESGACTKGTCSTGDCSAAVRDGAENDRDCAGGKCPTCADGEPCGDASVCVSGVCTGGVCVSAACIDGVQNGAETDVDCGGDCPKCADGQACGETVDCVNNANCTATSLTCVCDSGYVAEGVVCKDVDECFASHGDCGVDATCTNTPGSHACVCNAGFTGDGVTCTDVDECLTAHGGCSADAACINTAGSRTCACNAGYSGDGVTCTDVDECLTANGGCSPNASCTNTAGSRTCSCNAGYSGNGFTCTPMCVDGLKNGDESDVDCGGGSCQSCGDGRTCAAPSDCASAVCNGGLCLAPVGGPLLWLKADALVGLNDGDAVALWADSSGNGNPAMQNDPARRPIFKTNILNGKPALRFDGLDDALGLTGGTVLSNLSLFIVYQLTEGAEGFSYYPVFLGGSDNISGQYYGLETLNGASDSSPDVIDIAAGFGNDARAYLGGVSVFDRWRVMSVSAAGTVHSSTLRVNGVPAAMSATGANVGLAIPIGNGDGTAWGGVGGAGQSTFGYHVSKSDIVEVIVYASTLTSTEQFKVETYLNAKYKVF